jgi:hypothetical protein
MDKFVLEICIMNHLLDMEARTLAGLIGNGDILGMRMFMERIHLPLDVQDRLLFQFAAMTHADAASIASILESDSQSIVPDHLRY